MGIDTPLECYMDDHWYKHIINKVDRDNYKADNYLNKFTIMCEVIGVNPDQTAHMNINKRGGDGSSKDKKLIGYINIFKNYINAEIKILNPDIIIACIGPNKNKIKSILFTHITPFDFNIDNHICHLYTGTYTYGSRKIPVYGMYHPGTLGWAKNNNNYKKIFEGLYTKYQRT